MKYLSAILLASALANAAVTGTVINGTLGKPQGGVAINLVRPTTTFDANPSGPGPVLFQSLDQTVTFNAAKLDPLACIHCEARVPKLMKFCGECGKEMAK